MYIPFFKGYSFQTTAKHHLNESPTNNICNRLIMKNFVLSLNMFINAWFFLFHFCCWNRLVILPGPILLLFTEHKKLY